MLVHLMLELYNIEREILSNEPLVRGVLDEYPSRIGMEKVSPVHLYDIETSNPLDAGLSGFVVIAQSHVSLHAWPEYGEVDIDICSCKEFSRRCYCVRERDLPDGRCRGPFRCACDTLSTPTRA